MKDHKEQYIDSLFIVFDEMGFAPTTVCPDPEKYAIEWREKVRAEFERLEIENAALRERLDKAVDLPCKIGDIVYQTDTDGLRIFESTVKNIIFETSSIAFDEQAIGESIFLTEEAVEEKMKKLQEKKQ